MIWIVHTFDLLSRPSPPKDDLHADVQALEWLVSSEDHLLPPYVTSFSHRVGSSTGRHCAMRKPSRSQIRDFRFQTSYRLRGRGRGRGRSEGHRLRGTRTRTTTIAKVVWQACKSRFAPMFTRVGTL